MIFEIFWWKEKTAQALLQAHEMDKEKTNESKSSASKFEQIQKSCLSTHKNKVYLACAATTEFLRV